MSKENLKQNNNKILISTGNVLSFNKKVGQKPVEELLDCLNATFTHSECDEATGQIRRTNDDLFDRIEEYERDLLKIGVKIFMNKCSTESIKDSIDGLLQILNINYLDNFILAYHPFPLEGDQKTNGDLSGDRKPVDSESFEWSPGNENAFKELKALWKVLEDYQKDNKIIQLGISDLDATTLKRLYESSEVPPTIAKINLSACCVVPPSLQDFCNKNDIQLLTHSDPEVFLKEDALKEWNFADFEAKWAVRYTVHVKCRGLLAVKGYLVGASKPGKIQQ